MVLGLENYRPAWEKLKYPIWKRNDYAAIKRTTHYCHHIMRTPGMVNGTKAVDWRSFSEWCVYQYRVGGHWRAVASTTAVSWGHAGIFELSGNVRIDCGGIIAEAPLGTGEFLRRFPDSRSAGLWIFGDPKHNSRLLEGCAPFEGYQPHTRPGADEDSTVVQTKSKKDTSKLLREKTMLNYLRQLIFNEAPTNRPTQIINRIDSQEDFSRSTWRLATAVALSTNCTPVNIGEVEDLR